MSIRTVPLVLAAAAAMALAAPAMAKEIEEATVCGADGCAKVTPRGNAHAMAESAGAVTDAPKPAPFYRIRLGIGDGSGQVFERFWLVYVPSADKLRAMDGQWVRTTTTADRALDRVTRGRKPLPATKLKLTKAQQDAQSSGNSLPPEIVTAPPDDGPGSGSGGGGVPGWVIVLAAGGGLALVGGGAAWALRRRTEGGGEAAVAP
jgi:hypothetical protein